jgi:hypothetical protein
MSKLIWVVVIFVILAICVGLFLAAHIERYQGLGHGFFLLSRWRRTNGGFESIYHYQELRHYWKNLGRTGPCFVSPSGRFALYESFEREGQLLLFDADSGRTSNVTDGDFAIPSDAEWHEPDHEIHLLYYEKHKPSVIHLPN